MCIIPHNLSDVKLKSVYLHKSEIRNTKSETNSKVFTLFLPQKVFLKVLKEQFTPFFKSVGFPTLLSPPAISYNKGVVLMWFRIFSGFLLIYAGYYDIRDSTRWLQRLEKCRLRFELHSSKVGGQF